MSKTSGACSAASTIRDCCRRSSTHARCHSSSNDWTGSGMYRTDLPLWGKPGDSEPGWIALGGHGKYHHRFGGSSWRTLDAEAPAQPVLLVALDLCDPALAE